MDRDDDGVEVPTFRSQSGLRRGMIGNIIGIQFVPAIENRPV